MKSNTTVDTKIIKFCKLNNPAVVQTVHTFRELAAYYSTDLRICSTYSTGYERYPHTSEPRVLEDGHEGGVSGLIARRLKHLEIRTFISAKKE